MPTQTIHECQCGPCLRGEAHVERERHYQMNVFLSRLDEDQRRWYLALESQRMGWGADRLLMEITGVDEKTIRRGREELKFRTPDIEFSPVIQNLCFCRGATHAVAM